MRNRLKKVVKKYSITQPLVSLSGTVPGKSFGMKDEIKPVISF